MNKTIVVGADTETIDPLMKTCGYSWKYNKGCILDTSLYYEETDEVKVIAGLYNQNCPYSAEERQKANEEVINLLKNPDVLIVGANLMYDIGWWLYEYKMTVFEVKCRFFDVLSAESVIDEYSNTNLDKLSYKYLKYGKTKDNVETWVRENVSAKGDFRQYLKEVPYELLCEYAKGDAKNPVHIMRKQHTILRQEGLLERAKLDMDCILPILQITINGFPFDFEQKEKNLHILTKARNALAEDFKEKYGKSLNVNSSQQVADFLEEQNIPFKYKITLRGYKGKLFENYEEIDSACRRAKKLVASFRFVKRVPVAYVPCEMKDRTCDLLTEEGFTFNCSPNIDKSFYKTMREQYEIVGTLADWKSANGIIAKILGDKYNQYVAHDLDGTDRIHAEYHINKSEGAGTISSRLSSTKPNNQQIPSKNGLKLKDGTELSFPALTRALFHSEKGAVLFKIDYSQIEYRLIVNYAIGEGAEEARALFNKDKHTDFHQYVVELTGLSRKYAKNMSFGCFSTDSLWLTEKGWQDCKGIRQDNVLDLDGHKQKSTYFVFKDNGLKFTLSNGVQFVVNRQHEFLNCEKAEKEMLTKKAFEMKVGDRVPLTLLKAEGENTMSIFSAYLSGLYIGDGCGCGCNGSISLISHKENAEWVKHCLEESNYGFSVREESKVIRFCVHKEAKPFFHTFGTRTGNKHITNDIFKGTREIRLSFLAGFLDSDGTVTKDSLRFMGTNEKLLREVALLCSTLGFDCGFSICDRSKDNKPTEYTVLVYNTNGEIIPSVYRKNTFKQAKTDVRGWKLDRQGAILKAKRSNSKLYKEEPQLYEYLIRDKRNCFVHNSFIPSDCWQKNYIPVEIVKIEEVAEAEFVFLNTSSNYYNANGIATHNCAYGMSVPSMAETFGWTLEKAQEIADQYNEHMPFVKPTLALVGDVAKERGYIKTVLGNKARLRNPNLSYTMLNRLTQGSSADILKASIRRAFDEGVWKDLKIHVTVHDELDGSVYPTEEQVKRVIQLENIMETTVPLKIPLLAEAELGMNWNDVKEAKEWLELKEKGDEEWLNAPEELKTVVELYAKLKQ